MPLSQSIAPFQRISLPVLWLALIAQFASSPLQAADALVDISKLPPPASVQIDFDRDIQPILERSCLRCHGPQKPKSRFRLDQREFALKGGEHGAAILPGKSAESPLIHMVTGLVEDMEMPPSGKAEPLTPQEIGLLRAWIDQDLPWSKNQPAPPRVLFHITPGIRWIHVSGDERKFREHQWMNDGWSAGFQEFNFEQVLSPSTKLSLNGKSFFNDHDYQLNIGLDKQDFGYIHFGAERYRRYYDDTGGYFPAFPTNSFNLDRDLHLDLNRVHLDLGLNIPDRPQFHLGYEFLSRNGAKSMLSWSDVFDASGESAALYPAYKDIEEQVHIAKLDVSHEINGFLLEDNLRLEFYELDTQRINRSPFAQGEPLPDNSLRTIEEHDHIQAVNTVRVEKQVLDWLFLSGGYLYSKLDGDASFSLEAFMPSDPSSVLFIGEQSDRVILDRRSHIFSLNSGLGPWDGLSLSAGIQSEWTREEGTAESFLPGFPSPNPKSISSNRDKLSVEEIFGLRYSKIPFTVLFAETRFQQEGIDHFENQLVNDQFDDNQDLLRDTDATSDLKEFRAGFNLSPWRKISLHSSFKHRLKESEYDHLRDFDGSETPGNGFPAFIQSREIEADEFEAKLVLHWVQWLKTSLKYQWITADYRSVTDPSSFTTFDPILLIPIESSLPGGSILAGEYDAHVYSLNATLNPWRRLLLSSTFSYSDSRSVSGIKDVPAIAPFQGDVFAVHSNATFIWNSKTDLHASYSFSWADFAQDVAQVGGLPLGVEYERHGIITGITRRFQPNLTTQLQYGFFDYNEPSFGRANNYSAHAIFASLSLQLP